MTVNSASISRATLHLVNQLIGVLCARGVISIEDAYGIAQGAVEVCSLESDSDAEIILRSMFPTPDDFDYVS